MQDLKFDWKSVAIWLIFVPLSGAGMLLLLGTWLGWKMFATVFIVVVSAMILFCFIRDKSWLLIDHLEDDLPMQIEELTVLDEMLVERRNQSNCLPTSERLQQEIAVLEQHIKKTERSIRRAKKLLALLRSIWHRPFMLGI